MIFHHLVCNVAAVQIEVADHSHGGAGLAAAALIAEAFLGDVGQGEQISRITGAVLTDSERAGAPVRHDSKDRAHVIYQLVGILCCLNVDVAGEARFSAAEAIRHQLRGVLAGGKEGKLIKLRGLDVIAEAVAG